MYQNQFESDFGNHSNYRDVNIFQNPDDGLWYTDITLGQEVFHLGPFFGYDEAQQAVSLYI